MTASWPFLLGFSEYPSFLREASKITKIASECDFMLNVYFEERLEEDLDEFKRSVGFRF